MRPPGYLMCLHVDIGLAMPLPTGIEIDRSVSDALCNPSERGRVYLKNIYSVGRNSFPCNEPLTSTHKLLFIMN
jgi:hypothetical protein